MKAYRHLCEVQERAMALLRAAGFELRGTSRRSEACYFGWPGNPELLRVATHRYGGELYGLAHVAATLTLNKGMFRMGTGGVIVCPDDKVRDLVAIAIGRYFLAGVAQGDAAGLKPPLSSGSNPDARTSCECA